VALVYKLLDRPAWLAAQAAGAFEGSAVDRVQETARRHFRGVADLVLLAVDAEALGAALRWEPSRGGALFPHLYGPMPVAAVRQARTLALGADGAPVVGELAP
jgi:uncharacterized protein (DUF952 family)